MTEKLAGRGEGLADRLTESIWAISDGQHPDKDTLRNLIRNILAAAPAGTAAHRGSVRDLDTTLRAANLEIERLRAKEDSCATAPSVTNSAVQPATGTTSDTGTSDVPTWKTVIVGLPIIRKLLAGQDVELETLRVNLIPDDVLWNARAALATPSPQAPQEQSNTFSTTSAREQSSATAADSLGVAVYVALHFDQEQHGWPRVAGVYSTYEAAESRVEELGCGATQSLHLDKPVLLAVPAATQEQPAGSVASSNEHELLVGGIVRAALELAILRGDLRMDSGDAFEEMSESEREDVITDTWNAMNGEGTCDDEPVKELKAIYVALGSPRKVGEDGALEADDYRLVPVRLIQRFGAGVPGNEADTRWTVCLPNGDYAHIFPEYLLAQPTPQASSEIREAHGIRLTAKGRELLEQIIEEERKENPEGVARIEAILALSPSRQGAGGK